MSKGTGTFRMSGGPMTLDEIDAYLELAHNIPTAVRGTTWQAHVDALNAQRQALEGSDGS